MPSASVRVATAVKPGFFDSMRTPNRRSCSKISSIGSPLRSRTSTFVCSIPPSLISACRRASSVLMPVWRFSSMCSWRWLSISAARSRSRRSLPNNSHSRNSHPRSLFIKPLATRDSNPSPLVPDLCKSFVAQCNDRSDLHGPPCRNVGCHDRDKHQQKRDACEGQRIGGFLAVEQAGHEAREKQGAAKSKGNAKKREPCALTDDKAPHFVLVSAESHADSDFTRALRHGVRDNAINPDGAQSHGECREKREEGSGRARAGDRLGNPAV